MFTPILIIDKNTCELGSDVNPTSKKLNFSRFWTFYVPKKTLGKVGEKQFIMSLSMLGNLTLGVGIYPGTWQALSLVKIPTSF